MAATKAKEAGCGLVMGQISDMLTPTRKQDRDMTRLARLPVHCLSVKMSSLCGPGQQTACANGASKQKKNAMAVKKAAIGNGCGNKYSSS